ncbi:hypothetical protein GT354_16900, partial [Streptomyces sp. SID3343]|nr:hypothetical protein [Streptomyces sp. SID3343]
AADDMLHHVGTADLPADPEASAPWRAIGAAGGAIALAGMNGRLYAVDAGGRLSTRLPIPGPADFTPLPGGDPPAPG